MLTNGEIIVGLWFVPVVLFIVVPLAILCTWAVIKSMKYTGKQIRAAEQSAELKKKEIMHDNLRSQSPA